MIDLHIHTTSSDGSDEPVDILKMAQKADLKYISITDHDSLGAYKKLKQIKIESYFDGHIIPGCEVSAVHNGKPVEILAYGIDIDTMNSSGIISDDKFLERENGYLSKMKAVCRDLGISHTPGLSITSKLFATQVMHSDLRKYPENEKHFTKEVWEKVNAFYRIYINNPDSPFYLNQAECYPTIQEAADIVRKAGGKAFLAHLYAYFADNHEELLSSYMALNALDGIECYHSLHSMEITNKLLSYCKKNMLHASGGSDYHGKLKPTVRIGECITGVKIPYEILEPWLTQIHNWQSIK
ncbi:MAG: PHP domain-containing protein [Bacillota bacterium]